MSCVMCCMSHVTSPFFLDKVVEQVGGGSVINRATKSSYSYSYRSDQGSVYFDAQIKKHPHIILSTDPV